MRKFFLLLVLVVIGNYGFSNDYEPEKMLTEVNYDVAMYFGGVVAKGTGVTALQTNIVPQGKADIVITSAAGKKFEITGMKCTSMVQALDASNNEVAYMVTLFTVKESSLNKLNKQVKKNQVKFSTLLNTLGEKDLDSEMAGTAEEPDTNTFAKLRNLQVYDIFVKTLESKEIHLQIYVENFHDAKDL